jgi:prepilin-type N-terminal cleavage/methylation domain-containing protein/prepilin-type processing-associated H-X9-DG protein
MPHLPRPGSPARGSWTLPLPVRSIAVSSSRKAFTLIELLTVIAIIGILAAIVISTVGSARRSAQRARCGSQLRQLGVAVALYKTENKSFYPPSFSGAPSATLDPSVPISSYWWWYSAISGSNTVSPLATAAGGVAPLHEIAICPLNKTDVAQGAAGGLKGFPYVVNYHVMATTGFPLKKESDIVTPSRTIMMADSSTGAAWNVGFGSVTSGWTRVGETHDSQTNILWCDGHVASAVKSTLTNANILGR